MIRSLKLKAKIILTVSLIVLLAFSFTIAVVSTMSAKMIKKEAFATAQEMASRYANSVDAYMEIGMDASRTLAQSMKGVRKSEIPDRKCIDNMLKQVLQENPNFLGVWTVWEPNALDGRDKDYINKPGHDATGRYVPNWNRYNGSISIEPTIDYEKPGVGDFYLIPKATGKETVMAYSYTTANGNSVLIASLIVPIVENNKFLGVVGIDISLDALQQMIAGIKPYQTGYSSIIDYDGKYVAAPNSGQLGKDIGEKLIQAKEAIKKAAVYSTEEYSQKDKTKYYKIFVPINIGLSNTPWSFVVNIPIDR